MPASPTLDSFFEPWMPSAAQAEALPSTPDEVRAALHWPALPVNQIKEFLRQSFAKLTVSPQQNQRVFDPESLESLRGHLTPLAQIIAKESDPESVDAFLGRYPFLSDLEEFKFFGLMFFAGKLEHKEQVFRVLYGRIKRLEQITEHLMRPPGKRDPLRIQLERWWTLQQQNALRFKSFHPQAFSPVTLFQTHLEQDQERLKQETLSFLRTFQNTQLLQKRAELVKAGVGSAKVQQELLKYKQMLDSKQKEHFFTYSQIKRVELLKESLLKHLALMQETLSRSLLLALPNEILAEELKLQFEQATHQGAFEKLGQPNNLLRLTTLAQEYKALTAGDLLKRLSEYPEHQALLKQAKPDQELLQRLIQGLHLKFTPEQLGQPLEKLLHPLLLRLAGQSLQRRSYRFQLDLWMAQHREQPLFPAGVAYDYGAIAEAMAKTLFEQLFNPYQELYEELKRGAVLDWSVHQLSERDRLQQTQVRSALKAQLYRERGVPILNEKNERRDDFFYQALQDKERCHLTTIRLLEWSALEHLPGLRFESLLENLREQVVQIPGEKEHLGPVVECFSSREDWQQTSNELLKAITFAEHMFSKNPAGLPKQFFFLAPALTDARYLLQQRREAKQQRQHLLEKHLAELTRPLPIVASPPPEPPPPRVKAAPAAPPPQPLPLKVSEPEPEVQGERLHTFKPEAPSWRNTSGEKTDTRVMPLPAIQEELEQRHFLQSPVNYYSEFVEVVPLIFKRYKESIIRCPGLYLYDPSITIKLPFEEQVIYFQIDDNHLLAIGHTLMFVDPTLTSQAPTYYTRFFVRNKIYGTVPRELGKAYFKNMTDLQTEQTLNVFEEIMPGQLKRTPEVHFKQLFKNALLAVIRTLPPKDYAHPAVDWFQDYLVPNRPQRLALEEPLLHRIRQAGLEDRLPLKSAQEILNEHVHPAVHRVYKLLKAANAPIFQARKAKLDSQNVNFRYKEAMLNKIREEDKIRLYTMAIILELYLALKQRFPETSLQDLSAIAAHFYNYTLRSLPEGVKVFLQAHLEIFQKWEKNIN